jgi:hypothetical protein
MRSFKSGTTRNIISYTAILAVVFCAIIAAPMLSRARADGNTINVTNNTSRDLTHVYLAAPERDNWSADQLNDTVLSPGQSFMLTDVACYESGIKVIAEDADGCFVSTSMACAANGSWTITDNAVLDCGR